MLPLHASVREFFGRAHVLLQAAALLLHAGAAHRQRPHLRADVLDKPSPTFWLISRTATVASQLIFVRDLAGLRRVSPPSTSGRSVRPPRSPPSPLGVLCIKLLNGSSAHFLSSTSSTCSCPSTTTSSTLQTSLPCASVSPCELSVLILYSRLPGCFQPEPDAVALVSLPGQRCDRASSSIHPGRSLGRLSLQAGRRPTRLSDLRLPPRRAGPRRGLFCNSSWLRIHVHHKHISNSLSAALHAGVLASSASDLVVVFVAVLSGPRTRQLQINRLQHSSILLPVSSAPSRPWPRSLNLTPSPLFLFRVNAVTARPRASTPAALLVGFLCKQVAVRRASPIYVFLRVAQVQGAGFSATRSAALHAGVLASSASDLVVVFVAVFSNTAAFCFLSAQRLVAPGLAGIV
nr:uncharacterized protein LOC127329357 [Lolium perenne]